MLKKCNFARKIILSFDTKTVKTTEYVLLNRRGAFFRSLMVTVLFLSSLQAAVAVGPLSCPAGAELPADTSAVSAADSLLSTAERLSRLMCDPLTQTVQVGVEVYDLTADSLLFAYNHRQTMRPASAMKLLTAVTALDRLGPRHRFSTRLYCTGTVADSTLHGNVYCEGRFDPRFDDDDLRAFADSLLALGIDSIDGSFCADLSMKDNVSLGQGWCWDDDNPTLTPLTVGRSDQFMARLISRLLDAGVCCQRSYMRATVPPQAWRVCTREHSMDQVLMPMMKESDNFYAEAMLYQLAAADAQGPATAKDGLEHIRRLIRRLGFNPSDYRLADGSGLSLYNYVSPQLLCAFLKYAWQTPDVYVHLYPSLPIGGVDGTLKKRMRSSHTYDNVHAKTGTLTGVISLAGYCTTATGRQLCFAVICQGALQPSRAHAFQDRLCQILCQ